MKAVAYIRVSKERDDMISPELQRISITEHCRKHDYELVCCLEDLDLTGRFWKRRQVETAIAMIEAGEADVLVVWKISRVARNRKDWAIAVDRVEVAGGRLESATEALDSTTSTGRFTRGMLAELAAFESERIGETWRETHMRRLNAGLPHSGKARFGYAYDRDLKLHVPDDNAPVLAEAYRRYIDGESVYSLVRWLNAAGYRTTEGNLWRDRTLRRVLDSGFAAGRLTYGESEFRGVHEHLITEDEWAAYQARHRTRRRIPARSVRSQYLLSGMLRCACGSSMTAGQFGTAHQPKYRCQDAKERGPRPERCHPGGGYVLAHFVEEAVIEWLRGVASLDGSKVELVTRAAATRGRAAVTKLARRIAVLDAQLVELTRQLVAGVVPEDAYRGARAQMEAERDSAERQMIAADDGIRLMPAAPAATAAALLARWDGLPVDVRRASLRQLIEKVVVTTGRPRATFEIVPAWLGEIRPTL